MVENGESSVGVDLDVLSAESRCVLYSNALTLLLVHKLG